MLPCALNGRIKQTLMQGCLRQNSFLSAWTAIDFDLPGERLKTTTKRFEGFWLDFDFDSPDLSPGFDFCLKQKKSEEMLQKPISPLLFWFPWGTRSSQCPWPPRVIQVPPTRTRSEHSVHVGVKYINKHWQHWENNHRFGSKTNWKEKLEATESSQDKLTKSFCLWSLSHHCCWNTDLGI